MILSDNVRLLSEKVTSLLGRDIEVERTRDGKYIVLFMSLTSSPPPKGDTPQDALEKFIAWYENSKIEVAPDLDLLEEDNEDPDRPG